MKRVCDCGGPAGAGADAEADANVEAGNRLLTQFLVSLLLFVLAIASSSKVLGNDISDSNNKQLRAVIGSVERAGVLLLDPRGRPHVSINADQTLIPASTAKLLLALMTMKHWGGEYRFSTDIYHDSHHQNLWIVGGGDPFLVSEELALIADQLVTKLDVNNLQLLERIAVDQTLFDLITTVPGQTRTDNPYDAMPAALAANFNTINVRVAEGAIVSAEPQTPITPIAQLRATELGLLGTDNKVVAKGRFNLGGGTDVNTLKRSASYAAQLLQSLIADRLEKIQAGTDSLRESFKSQHMLVGRVPEVPLLYSHSNSKNLFEVLQGMLTYSNNFIANQLALVLAADVSGKAGNFALFEHHTEQFVRANFSWREARLEEGAGLSRDNRLSARHLTDVVKALSIYNNLLPQHRDGVFAKTGTLQGVSSLAGEIKPLGRVSATGSGHAGDPQPWQFAIILNDNELANPQLRDAILEELQQIVSAATQ